MFSLRLLKSIVLAHPASDWFELEQSAISKAMVSENNTLEKSKTEMIGPYIIRAGDTIHVWNRKDGVDAQTLPYPFRLKLLHNSKVCTQARPVET